MYELIFFVAIFYIEFLCIICENVPVGAEKYDTIGKIGKYCPILPPIFLYIVLISLSHSVRPMCILP